MGRARILCLIVVELFLLVVSDSSASLLPQRDSSRLFLGIASRDEEYYSADVISCRDGSKSFTKDRLNDGFCDCPDGTDEPGTSACPESRFYCRNIGDVPRILYSSRVNDHICDCCDGSDEYDGYTTCPNTCSKGQVASNNSKIDYAGRRQIDRIHEQANRRIVDVGMLVENLTDLSVVMVVELVVFCIGLSCLCHWKLRNRRRRYLLKS